MESCREQPENLSLPSRLENNFASVAQYQTHPAWMGPRRLPEIPAAPTVMTDKNYTVILNQAV
jgi:hypothetical protein